MTQTWITTKSKCQQLLYFYLNTTLGEMSVTCPFRKNKFNQDKSTQPCQELCGHFGQLGNISKGCPCETLGREGALIQLGALLRSKEML
jgi:hypothetical protein